MQFKIETKKVIPQKQFSEPIVLIGWPGIALIGKLSVESIRDSLGAELIMEIQCFDFPPKAGVEKGVLQVPKAKVYYKSRIEESDLIILTADYQPQSSEGVFEFCDTLCNELKQITGNKIKMYLSTGAMVTDQLTDGPTLHVCGTDDSIVNSFMEFDNTKIMETGVIAGANGILPAYAGANGFAPGICLLAETLPLPMMTLDPKASKALVALIKDYFKLDIDFTELDKKIEEMETMFDKFKKQANQFMREQPPSESGADSYFR